MDPRNTSTPIAVIGAGSWGTALAQMLASQGFPVHLWALEPEVAQAIAKQRENTIFLKGIPLSENVFPTNDLEEALSGKPLVLSVVPSQWVRETAEKMSPFISPSAIVVSCTKGIEVGTRVTMTAILREKLTSIDPKNVCVLSGPSFAREVAQGLPTVVTVAAASREVSGLVQQVFHAPTFRVYTNDDVIGVEVAGAVKNVMAIAAGICDGLNLGANARAAMITRGLTEIRRLGKALGANPRTFTGLAGVGDLLLTCTTAQSRNFTVGFKIGQGQKLADILADMRMVAEGVRNAKSVYNLSRQSAVDMPIVAETYRILYEDLNPARALANLMTRKLKNELDED